ncbi:MAG: HD domain-containing protein [Lachnospiraceae bacterium]|nr:HD domain-containing protein [Lachnospiraceae bacterium]
MEEGKFKDKAAVEGNPDFEKLIIRESHLYKREDDVRSEFARDYTRILHSLAYRRLKHKTQVFYNAAGNDHICTRIEHVAHVGSVATTISRFLGLNTELSAAIALAHDLGHAPFGHQGEKCLNQISSEFLGKPFWHEKNGLRMVDHIELLEDNYRHLKNLDLTYAVRDGIISHCGEVDDNGIIPREEAIDLEEDFIEPGQFEPYTWEGAVVKLSDKIAYLGRDIEDAITLKILERSQIEALEEMARVKDERAINTTVIMHNMIINICENSDPDKGIRLSRDFYEQLKKIQDFNIKNIYKNPMLQPFCRYSELVLKEIFKVLYDVYDGERTFEEIHEKEKYFPCLMKPFGNWLARYVNFPSARLSISGFELPECDNEKIYGNLSEADKYTQAVIDYISGMTDSYAIKVYEELLRY